MSGTGHLEAADAKPAAHPEGLRGRPVENDVVEVVADRVDACAIEQAEFELPFTPDKRRREEDVADRDVLRCERADRVLEAWKGDRVAAARAQVRDRPGR